MIASRSRWPRRALLGALGAAATGLVLLTALAVRPAVLIFPINWMLGDEPIRVLVDGARLEAPMGWGTPSRWQWRLEGFALMSGKPGTPTLLADVVVVRMPDVRRSWQERSVVLPHLHALGFVVAVTDGRIPPPFEEVDAWPLRGLVIDEGVLRGFELVLRDASGTTIAMDHIDGQVLGFRYDFGHRRMYGSGAARNGHVVVADIEAMHVRASPLLFSGTTFEARGLGQVAGQATSLLFAIDGLFRPAAGIHAEFDMAEGDVREILGEILGDEAPDVQGLVWGQAVFDSKPPEASLDLSFRVEAGQITLAEDTKSIILTALSIAPFVQLDDHLLRLGILSGHVVLADGVMTLTHGRYEAELSTAQVDARVDRASLRARVRFSPSEGPSGMTWGFLVSGSARHPKLQLATLEVLDAWSAQGDATHKDLREDVRDARSDRRELGRATRRAERQEAHLP